MIGGAALALILQIVCGFGSLAAQNFHPEPLNPEVLPASLRDPDVRGAGAATGAGVAAAAEWQGLVIQGVTQLVERQAKATAMAAGITRAQRSLCSGSQSLGYLESTCTILQNADPYLVPVGWSALQAAFRSDIEALPARLVQAPADDRAAVSFLKHVGRGIVLLESGAAFPEVVKGMAGSLSSPTYNGVLSLHVLDWATAVEIVAQVNPTTGWEKLATETLVKQRGVTLSPADSQRVGAFLVELRSQLAWADTLSRRARNLRTGDADSVATLRANAYSAFVTAGIDMLTGIGRLRLRAMDAPIPGTLEMALTAARRIDAAYAGARRRDYGAVFVQTIAAIRSASPGWSPPDALGSYMSFAVDLAQVRTEDAAADVLQRFALRPGSYVTKRAERVVGVNSYLGAYWGRECATEEDCPVTGGPSAYGFSAPIGIEVSTHFRRLTSLGLFISIVDVGTLLSRRTSEESSRIAPSDTGSVAVVEEEARVGIQQILSPGVHLTFGVPWFPAVVGLGASIVPDLRTLKEGENERALAVTRKSVFVALDLPLFRIR